MLVAAALVPDTALLVPGAGGSADAGAALRAAALDAVGEAAGAPGVAGADHGAEQGAARSRPPRVVVVAPGRADRLLEPPLRASLGAAGVPDGLVRWPAPGPAGAPVVGVPASVAVFLLARRGVVPARVLEVRSSPSDERPEPAGAGLRARGAALVADGPTALVVVGSPSGRHGPDAPLADDDRAPAYDDALLADLADAGPDARARLAALEPALADALAVTGWAPWQVLLGAVGDAPVSARLVRREVVAGASHAVLTWRLTWRAAP